MSEWDFNLLELEARLRALRNEQRSTPKTDEHRRGAITGEIMFINTQIAQIKGQPVWIKRKN